MLQVIVRPLCRVNAMYRCLLAYLAFALAVASPVHAADPGRSIFFGDSLSDPGNLFALTGMPPVPYVNGHFSNGPTWAEMLASPDNTFFSPGVGGNVNYAFGGARTDALGGLNGLTVVPGSYFGVADPVVNAPPGIPVQVSSYLNRGGSFGPKDTVFVWGGANDVFDLFDTVPGGTNDPTLPGFVNPLPSVASTATNAASNVLGVADTTYAAGARSLVFLNLPDLGSAPAYNTDPTAAAVGSFYSNTFNQALGAGVAAVRAARPDMNVVLVDVASAFASILNNPATFSLNNVQHACLAVGACVGGTPEVQNGYLFWDGVHPTTAGHALIAQTVKQSMVIAVPGPEAGGGLISVGFAVLAFCLYGRSRKRQANLVA